MIGNSAQNSIASRIEEIFYQQIGDDAMLSPETDLLNDLGMDSLEVVELGLKMEKAFGAKFPIADLRSCITIGEVIQLVERKAA